MIRFSVVDCDLKNRLKIINKCEKILIQKDYVFRSFDSVIDVYSDKDSLNYTDILIVNDKYINNEDLFLLNKILEEHNYIHIMFYGDKIESILKAYDVKHFYYVLMDRMDTLLYKAIAKGINLITRNSEKHLAIVYRAKIDVVKVDNILYIQRRNRVVNIHTKDKVYCTYESFDSILNSLDNYKFFQVSYSTLINPKYIKSYEHNYFYLNDDTEIKVSRSFESKINNVLNHDYSHYRFLEK